MTRKCDTAFLLAMVALIGLIPQKTDARQQTYRVIPLGEGQNVYVNNRGMAAFYSPRIKQNASVNIGVFWQNGLTVDLGTLGNQMGFESYPWAINDNGDIVGENRDSAGFGLSTGFLWKRAEDANHIPLLSGTMTALPHLGSKDNDAIAYGINNRVNNSVQVVGTALTDNQDAHAVSWSVSAATTAKDMGTLGGNYAAAYSINNQGAVCGGSDVSNGNTSIFKSMFGNLLGDGGHFEILGEAQCINDNGEMAGYMTSTSDSPNHAFVYTKVEGTWAVQDIHPFATKGSDQSEAYALNNKGQVVGEYGRPTAVDHAFLYDFNLLAGSDLNNFVPKASNWTLESADSINDAGQIGCSGTASTFVTVPPTKKYEVFLLSPLAYGVDISGGAGRVPNVIWQKLQNDPVHPYKLVWVEGWGPGNNNPLAAQQLLAASNAGMLTGGYCALSFHGLAANAAAIAQGQMDKALDNIQDNTPISVMAIDVENGKDPGFPVMTAIRSAIQELTRRRPTVEPIIYANATDWQNLTNNNRDQDIALMPLWEARYTPTKAANYTRDDDSIDTNFSHVWTPIGGFKMRRARQYSQFAGGAGDGNPGTNISSHNIRKDYGLSADVNIAETYLFNPAHSAIPLFQNLGYVVFPLTRSNHDILAKVWIGNAGTNPMAPRATITKVTLTGTGSASAHANNVPVTVGPFTTLYGYSEITFRFPNAGGTENTPSTLTITSTSPSLNYSFGGLAIP